MALSNDLDALVEANLKQINVDEESEELILSIPKTTELDSNVDGLGAPISPKKNRKLTSSRQLRGLCMKTALMTQTNYCCKFKIVCKLLANHSTAFVEMKTNLSRTQKIISDRYAKTFSDSTSNSLNGCIENNTVLADVSDKVCLTMSHRLTKKDHIMDMCKANVDAYLLAKTIEGYLLNVSEKDKKSEYQRIWLKLKGKIINNF